MPILSPKTGVLRESVIAGALNGRDLLVAKREFYLDSKVESPGEWTDAVTGRHYEVVGREADGDLVTFFVRAWASADKKTQLAFGRPGRAVGIERFRFQNIPVLTTDPLGGFEESGTDPDTGLVLTRPKLVEDPLLVARELIRQQVALTARIDASADFKATGRTVTTFYPAAGAVSPCDGEVSRTGVSESFSTIRTSAGNAANVTGTSADFGKVQSNVAANAFIEMDRHIICYDTSAIGSDAISSSVFSLWGTNKGNGNGDLSTIITSATPAATDNLASSDYSNLGTTALSGDTYTYAGWTASAYNDANLNASGISNINKGGVSKFGIRSVWDASGTYDGAQTSSGVSRLVGRLADVAGTSNDPKLTVTHAAAAGATSREPQPARFKNGRWHYYGRC